MKIKKECLKLLLLFVAACSISFFVITDKNEDPSPTISVNSTLPSRLIDGEQRARLVRERCESFPELRVCQYPSRGVPKRLLPVPHMKFAMCVVGKTGTSNWKTLILLLKGVITAEEAKNMVYPHSKEYWQDKGTLFYYDKERRKMANTIKQDYYKITFVRDPLSRILSAYRDKFTGTSQEHMFKVYRSRRALEMCTCLEELLLTKPDGDLVPDEIYSYMAEELKQHCKDEEKEEKFVSLGIFFLIFIFMPQDFRGDVLKDLTVNTHFNDMLSMCDHCRINYDFIGTVETMDSDFDFLRNKLGIEYDLPEIESTQLGVMSKAEVQAMWQSIPYLLKQYIYLFLSNDARAFGYSGYDVGLNKSLLPNHYEKRIKCDKVF